MFCCFCGFIFFVIRVVVVVVLYYILLGIRLSRAQDHNALGASNPFRHCAPSNCGSGATNVQRHDPIPIYGLDFSSP